MSQFHSVAKYTPNRHGHFAIRHCCTSMLTCQLHAIYRLQHSRPRPSYSCKYSKRSPLHLDFLRSRRPKVAPINATVFDWWYFDAVSPDLNSSLVVIFFTATNNSFPVPLYQGDLVPVVLSGSFPNQTLFNIVLNAEQAVITTVGGGSNGVFEGTNTSWTGNPDNSVYVVAINAPEVGVNGSFTLNAVSPPHYPCGPDRAGESMALLPGVGWANVVPDAVANIDIVIHGSGLKFIGVGYHDKNWGSAPFATAVQSWYWGHGRVGPYSLVWFSAISPSNVTYVSGYVTTTKPSHKDKSCVVTSSCDLSNFTIRPTGANSTYPPRISGGEPQGYHMEFAVEDGNTLMVDLTRTLTLQSSGGGGVYTRWIGSLRGNIKGTGQAWTGTGLWEQFAFLK
jgi:hypothetical protein